jgi:acetyl esterase/lipase
MIDVELMNPAAFPPQQPPADRRVADYVADVSAASRQVIREWPPQRRAYGPHASHVLDIFAEADTVGRRPALIFFHGGAWIAGYPWWSSYMASGVRRAGGILVTPTYRLAPEEKFPRQLEDVAAAIAWVFRNAALFGIDADRLVIGGHSAGGHLAALACLHPTALPEAGVSHEVVKACMPVSSSFNLHWPNAAPGSGEERIYKFLLAERSDDLVASPINHLSGRIPPFHIVYGEHDFERIVRTSRDMAAAIRSRHRPTSIQEWRGLDHFDTHLALRDPQHPWYARLRDVFAATAPSKQYVDQ